MGESPHILPLFLVTPRDASTRSAATESPLASAIAACSLRALSRLVELFSTSFETVERCSAVSLTNHVTIPGLLCHDSRGDTGLIIGYRDGYLRNTLSQRFQHRVQSPRCEAIYRPEWRIVLVTGPKK